MSVASSAWGTESLFLQIAGKLFCSLFKSSRKINDKKCFFSVLAAASPVFRDFFMQSPLVEENERIVLAGYSFRALSSVIEYVYTGCLEFVTEDKVSSRTCLFP